MFWWNKKHPNTIFIDNREYDKGFIGKIPTHWFCFMKIPINLKTSYPSNSNGSIQSNQSFKNT